MMKRVVFLSFLGFAFLAMAFLATGPAMASDKDLKDPGVDVLKPFEQPDPGKIGISEVKVRQLKKAEHVIIREIKEPPRIRDEIDKAQEPNIAVAKVKPFDKRDLDSRKALPLAGETEFAGALEFQDLDDTLEGRVRADKGLPKNSADVKRIENVFQFKHVAGNDKMTAPLFNRELDPRVVSIQKGSAELDTAGNFKAGLNGISVDSMANPGFLMSASVFCGDGREVHRTGLFPIDETGNMAIQEQMMFPPDCVAPAVLFSGPEGMLTGAAGGVPMSDVPVKEAPIQDTLNEAPADEANLIP
ncbi:MAG: hypothetical protein AAGU11_15210 [Syntrophobacteraceae bacterium]